MFSFAVLDGQSFRHAGKAKLGRFRGFANVLCPKPKHLITLPGTFQPYASHRDHVPHCGLQVLASWLAMEAQDRPVEYNASASDQNSRANYSPSSSTPPKLPADHLEDPAPGCHVSSGIQDGDCGEDHNERSKERAVDVLQQQVPTPADNDSKLGISKNQLKKLKRRQEWEDDREGRKKRRKQKKLEQKERRRQSAAKEADATPKPKGEAPKPKRSVQVPVTILVDCGFDDLMTEKERISLASQITRTYSENSHAPFRAHLALSSFDGQLRHRFDTVLSGFYRSWKSFRPMDDNFVAVAATSKDWMADPSSGGRLVGALTPKAKNGEEVTTTATNEDDGARKTDQTAGETVYLTSESPNTLTSLKPNGTYIIGGLVDKNRHKGICYQRALDRGIRTAKLPISDYMDMSSRFVLATNHVAEILLAWLEHGDWGRALAAVMPKRKGARLKDGKEDGVAIEDRNGDEDGCETVIKEAVQDGKSIQDQDEETFQERSAQLE